jgi:hypothetical protein
LKSEGWPVELLETMYLEDETKAWQRLAFTADPEQFIEMLTAIS